MAFFTFWKCIERYKAFLWRYRWSNLVDGSTHFPAVEHEEMTGKEPNVTVNPSEVVGLGAIVQVCPIVLCSSLFMEENVKLSIFDIAYCST